MKRRAFVAGSFYPGNRTELERMIDRMADTAIKKEKALAVVSPHAGYVYSGPVAAAVFSSVRMPGVFIILGPAHGEIGSTFAIQREGFWSTPLGDVLIETDLADLLMSESDLIEEDEEAHVQEHSLEVQVPFIQFFVKAPSLVPICVSYAASFSDLESLGGALAQAITKLGKDVLIVASTDMSHYVQQKKAEKNDFQAIDKILALDPGGLYQTVIDLRITMCGYQPTVASLIAAVALGAKKADLIKYQTSGDTSGDYDKVVGYAGVRIS